MSYIAKLKSTRCFPIVLSVHLTLLICLYYSWYAYEDRLNINLSHSTNADAPPSLSVDQAVILSHDIWLQPRFGNENIASAWEAIREKSNTPTRTVFTTYTADTMPYQFILVGKSRAQQRSDQILHISWGKILQTSKSAHHTHTVVMFEYCQQEEGIVDFFNIYSFYDEIVHCTALLQSAFPGAVVVWISPETVHNIPTNPLSLIDSRELDLLHMYLAYNYLVRQKGLMVVSGVLEARAYYAERQHSHANCIGTGDGGTIRHEMGFLRHGEQDSPWQTAISQLQCQLSEILRSAELKPAQRNGSPFQQLVQYQHNKLLLGIPNLHAVCSKYTITRKYDANCHPPSSLTHPFLITGLGGAGTHFVAKTLRMQGWRVLHEDMDKDGAVSWIYAASDWALQMDYPYGALPAGQSSFLRPRYGHVVHLVRSPLDQISSFTAHSNKTYNFVLRTMELFLPNSSALDQLKKSRTDQRECHRGGNCHLEFAALSWLYWNRFVHSFADATFRVDQVAELQEHMCQVASAAALVRDAPLSPLMKSRRFCEISDCPAVNDAHRPSSHIRGLENLGFAVLDKALGVCALNEALFRRSAAHKRHHKYELADIANVDSTLAIDIQRAARYYGFDF